MSKMSQLHAELSEQATELGFESLDMALANGYDIDYQSRTLVNGQELAHKDYERRRDELLEELSDLRDMYRGVERTEDLLNKTIDFIKEGEI